MRTPPLAPLLIVAALTACSADTEPLAPPPEPSTVAGTAGGFHQVSAGVSHACAISTAGQARCWGYNASGALGNGQGGDGSGDSATTELKPVAVGYCWGYNRYAQLGNGTIHTLERAPVAVSGNLRFRQVSAGEYHVCAVTTSDQAYCWGDNSEGQLGVDTDQRRRRVPTLVAGGRAFRDRAVRAPQRHCVRS